MIGGCSVNDPFSFNEMTGIEKGWQSLEGKTQHDSHLTGIVKTIILGGQSNMSNSLSTAGYTRTQANSLMLNIYDGAIYSGDDPCLGCGNIAAASCVALPLADSLITRLQCNVCVVVPIAIGGTAFADWVPSNAAGLFGRLSAAVLRCRARGLEPDAIIWGQGERDNTLGTAQDTVRDQIRAIVDGVRALGCLTPFYPGLYTMTGGSTSATVRAGITASVDPGRNMIIGYDADTNCTVAGGFRNADQTHLSATGRSTAASGWSNLVFP